MQWQDLLVAQLQRITDRWPTELSNGLQIAMMNLSRSTLLCDRPKTWRQFRSQWKSHSLVFVLLLCFLVRCEGAARAVESSFPRAPIKIVVYTGPGGLLDTTARRFGEIARRYSEATFVVQNQTGAGGLVAMDAVLQSPTDGYTVLACTKSNIAKILMADRRDLLEAFDWRCMLVAETECLIVKADSPIESFAELVDDARQRKGDQIWLGPASGGLDHVTAAKIWKRFGFSARWIPYTSGNEAMTALLGGQGQVYVGNPSDATDNPLLRVITISNPQRLAQYPSIPIFADQGAPELDHQFMWRGFAFRKGVDPEILRWYDDLFQKVTQDPEWRSIWENEGAQVFYRDPKDFAQQIHQDAEEFSRFHEQLGLYGADNAVQASSRWNDFLRYALTMIVIGTWVGAVWRAQLGFGLRTVILPLLFQAIALVLLWMTKSFPSTGETIGAGAMPQLWLGLLILAASFVVLRSAEQAGTQPTQHATYTDALAIPIETTDHRVSRGQRGGFLLAIFGYACTIVLVGYYLATVIWLFSGARLLGQRRTLTVAGVALLWLLIAYFGFEQLLHVPLPRGWLSNYVAEAGKWKP